MVSAVPAPAVTVIGTGADVTVAPVASRATAVTICAPLAAVTAAEYGAAVSSGPAFVPSTLNWTPTTGPVTVADTVKGSDTLALVAGALIATVIAAAAVAVKSTPLTSAPPTDTFRMVGVNATPLLLGVTMYGPFASPVNTNPPAALAVVLPVAMPPSVTVADAPLATGVIVPDTE